MDTWTSTVAQPEIFQGRGGFVEFIGTSINISSKMYAKKQGKSFDFFHLDTLETTL